MDNTLYSLAPVALAAYAVGCCLGAPEALPVARYNLYKSAHCKAASELAACIGVQIQGNCCEVRSGENEVRIDVHGQNAFGFVRKTDRGTQVTTIKDNKARTSILFSDGRVEIYTQKFSPFSGLYGQKKRSLLNVLPNRVLRTIEKKRHTAVQSLDVKNYV